jgi:hypothetical protein
MESYRMGFKRVLGLCLLTALAGCAAKDKNDGDNSMNGVQGGTGGAASNSMSSGTGGSGAANAMGTGTGGKGSTGGNTMNTGSGGTGSNSMGGGSGMMANTMGGGAGDGGGSGMGGGGSGGDTGGSGIDTSSFMKDCKSSGENWGTPSQAGPCSSGETIYGVKIQFGPYGASSEHDVGKGFETGGTDDTDTCNGENGFINSFGADPVGSADLMDTHGTDFSLFTVFYPGAMPEGEKFPLITWGNGTCAMPEGYGTLLRYVASYGYIIVAAQDREVGSGASMLKGLDFMIAENDKEGSKYYHHIDTDKIGAMGHSQGAIATVSASSDPRVKAIIAFNSGTSSTVPFLDISGDRDLFSGTDPSGLKNDTEFSQQKGAWLWYHQIPDKVGPPPGSTTGDQAPGHLTLMMEPERVMEPTVAWWDMILKDKEEAKKMFLGTDCTLCSGTAYPTMWPPTKTGSLDNPTLEYGHNAALQ